MAQRFYVRAANGYTKVFASAGEALDFADQLEEYDLWSEGDDPDYDD